MKNFFEGVLKTDEGKYKIGFVFDETQYWSNEYELKQEAIEKSIKLQNYMMNTLENEVNPMSFVDTYPSDDVKELYITQDINVHPIAITDPKPTISQIDVANIYVEKYSINDIVYRDIENPVAIYLQGKPRNESINQDKHVVDSKRYEITIYNEKLEDYQHFGVNGNVILSVTEEQYDVIKNRELHWKIKKHDSKNSNCLWIYWILAEDENGNYEERSFSELFGYEKYSFSFSDRDNNIYYLHNRKCKVEV